MEGLEVVTSCGPAGPARAAHVACSSAVPMMMPAWMCTGVGEDRAGDSHYWL